MRKNGGQTERITNSSFSTDKNEGQFFDQNTVKHFVLKWFVIPIVYQTSVDTDGEPPLLPPLSPPTAATANRNTAFSRNDSGGSKGRHRPFLQGRTVCSLG